MQRELAGGGKAVLEGRDTGSVVCPNAILKIFLTASIEERVYRRKLQLRGKKCESDTPSIKKEITSRDKIDTSRRDSPLIVPENGIVIDTSHMSIDEVVNKIKELYHDRTNT